jgi:cellulose synthase/poly-beta-1,6-N-acetylglucosamine synthase-like glycosyltransferase
MFLLAISSLNWNDPAIKEYYKESELPTVTIQIPVFNEVNVIHQTLTEIAKLLYPREKLLIQILDDSTDQTSFIIDNKIKDLKRSKLNCEIIRRKKREGYKAGALANALKTTKSEFIAIFDADFRVNQHFLEKTIHYFKNNSHIGAVQTRWVHSNLNFSLFTRSMSLGLDLHHLVEKLGRKRRNSFITFNGTGGIWRRSAIEKSGGWSSESVAEDLDLAYRAQMEGYEILYLKDCTNSQEIPPTLRCWIIQQSRWAKGFSQNLRKNFTKFIQNPSGKSRIQGSIQLTQYFVPLMILLNTITSSLLLYFHQFNGYLLVGLGILFFIALIFGVSSYIITILRAKRPLWNMLFIPLFLFWGASLIVRMGIGAIDGLLRKGGEFVRTPKFNLVDNQKSNSKNIREKITLDKTFFLELAYLIILWFGMVKLIEMGGIYLSQAVFYVFLLVSMLALLFSEILHFFSID